MAPTASRGTWDGCSCGGHHLPKLPLLPARASSVPTRERSAPAQQGWRLLPEAPLELADA